MAARGQPGNVQMTAGSWCRSGKGPGEKAWEGQVKLDDIQLKARWPPLDSLPTGW